VGYLYSLFDLEGDDLGLLEHESPSLMPDDGVTLPDGRLAIITGRAESKPGAPVHALLEVEPLAAGSAN
jgi:hypothetical protein